jgi:nicotinamidase-related amidase
MEKSLHFKLNQRALLLIDHQVGTLQPIKDLAAYGAGAAGRRRSADAAGLLRGRR